MSLRACIPGMVERGEIDQEKGAEMSALFDELHQDFRRQFGDQAADAMATDATIAELERRATRRKVVQAGQIRAQQRIGMGLEQFGGGRGGGPIDPKAGE